MQIFFLKHHDTNELAPRDHDADADAALWQLLAVLFGSPVL